MHVSNHNSLSKSQHEIVEQFTEVRPSQPSGMDPVITRQRCDGCGRD